MKVSGIHSPLESRVLHINGIALHVVLAGPPSGKPLIFLHGFPEFWFAWRRQIDHFVSLGYRVIIPDQRGYNLSDKPAGIANYSIESHHEPRAISEELVHLPFSAPLATRIRIQRTAMLSVPLRDTSAPGLFSNSDLEQYKG